LKLNNRASVTTLLWRLVHCSCLALHEELWKGIFDKSTWTNDTTGNKMAHQVKQNILLRHHKISYLSNLFISGISLNISQRHNGLQGSVDSHWEAATASHIPTASNCNAFLRSGPNISLAIARYAIAVRQYAGAPGSRSLPLIYLSLSYCLIFSERSNVLIWSFFPVYTRTTASSLALNFFDVWSFEAVSGKQGSLDQTCLAVGFVTSLSSKQQLSSSRTTFRTFMQSQNIEGHQRHHIGNLRISNHVQPSSSLNSW
jgi:hypothetical protein